ncbi:MAG: DEAD/DEAH box helicase [Bacteroidetes bacterium]|jgi:ATP-dependent RNA helicase DeaD|nr:DEAD/DEAH box helicase [Bacteroidota bacterium]MBT5992105.1 DEAD/DEAH box helicase [Bacteroidota bacterium]MBT7039524.1 DEAD/DEAH box helicase [Bacteroidota bacterium]
MITFDSLGLSSEILKATKELGFENPTPIQEKTIPVILSTESDIISLAQTGTGKTAAFGLPLIELSDPLSSDVQALVLSPTRELCVQITKDIANYSKYLPDFGVTAVYGGADIGKQTRDLKRQPQLVVGTPGRVLDMIKRRILKVKHIKYLVLDEADEMLNMGFKDDLDAILANTPQEKRTFLFSATMPNEIIRITNNYMSNPVEITAGKKNIGADDVSHEYYVVQAKHRYEALKRLADINPKIYGIVFCRTRKETKEIADKFIGDGYSADALHGDLSQAQRDHVMSRFRSKTIQMLVATDVAARGLDVNDLTHVINYNLPDELELYIHRSGRTGRAGKKGVCISIIHVKDKRKIRDIEKMISKQFTLKEVPNGSEICGKQLFNLIDRMEHTQVNETEIEAYMPEIYKKLEWMSREDLIKRFVSVEFNRFLSYYENAQDLNKVERDDRSDRPDRKGRSDRSDRSDNLDRGNKERKRSRDANFSRFFINLGIKQGLNPARLMGLINEQTRSKNIEIGRIDIMKKFSFFEVENSFEKSILDSFLGGKPAIFEGTKVAVEISKPESKPKPRLKPDFPAKDFKKSRSGGAARKRKSY